MAIIPSLNPERVGIRSRVASMQFSPILETGVTEIIGKDDTEVSVSGDYSSTADLVLVAECSGEILAFQLTSLETGSGAVQGGSGVVFFFDADPDTTSGDTALAAAGADHKTVIGIVAISATDWDSDASGGVAHKTVAIPFHSLSTIYCVYRNTDASAVWNSAGGDDEELHINVWYRRDQ